MYGICVCMCVYVFTSKCGVQFIAVEVNLIQDKFDCGLQKVHAVSTNRNHFPQKMENFPQIMICLNVFVTWLTRTHTQSYPYFMLEKPQAVSIISLPFGFGIDISWRWPMWNVSSIKWSCYCVVWHVKCCCHHTEYPYNNLLHIKCEERLSVCVCVCMCLWV